jgi:hypothetical protein
MGVAAVENKTNPLLPYMSRRSASFSTTTVLRPTISINILLIDMLGKLHLKCKRNTTKFGRVKCSLLGNLKMTVQCSTRRYMRFACCKCYMVPSISFLRIKQAFIYLNWSRIEREITQLLQDRYSKVAPCASRLGNRSNSQSIIGQGSCQIWCSICTFNPVVLSFTCPVVTHLPRKVMSFPPQPDIRLPRNLTSHRTPRNLTS